ncbi:MULTISPECIES: CAP domain-containing protein [Bacillus]|uniref:CAP domain-containing protein n=1 Tax=Bacillus TaxID=1386 RepID=UPI001D0D5A76|nr:MULTISPECIES: CAP domain-containing protein [Bacillus]
MNHFKLFLAALILLALTACGMNQGAQNSPNQNTGMDENLNTQQVNYRGDVRDGGQRLGDRLMGQGNRGMSQADRSLRQVTQRDNRSVNFQTNEVQQVRNGGYLTIDPNSYSTSTPSEKFPHSQKIQDGPFSVYKFELGRKEFRIPGGKGGQAASPEQGQPAPTPEQEQQQSEAPAQPAPEQQQPEAPAQPAPEQQQPEAPAQPAPETQQQEEAQQEQGNAEQRASQEGISETEMRVIELTNAERRKAGLSDLKADKEISNVARQKSADMQQNNYFSHTSPTYGSPFDMMRDFGISYNTAGENIAMGQRTPEEVVQAWMNSEGHRKNILSPNFTHIGVGYVENGHYWTQMFVGR